MAVVDPGGEPRLLARLPGRCDVDDVLGVLFADRRPEPVVVGAAGVPVAVAVGGGLPRIVIDGGVSGTEVTLVGPDGVGPTRTVDVGGARCDTVARELLSGASLEEARRVREGLSLLPAVTADGGVRLDAGTLRRALAEPMSLIVDAAAEVAELAGGGVAEVVLVGGLARTPLLAELFDAAGVGPVRVPPVPDVAAVLGALTPLPSSPRPSASRGVSATESGYSCDRVGVSPGPPLLPPIPPRRHRVRRAALGVAVGLIALLGAGAALVPGRHLANTAGELVQYGYRLALPAGWAHTGGLPERRRTLITPTMAPAGSDLVSIELSELGYDADAEPARARAELRSAFHAAVAGGERLTGFDPDGRFAGRAVAVYRQDLRGTVVDWYVVFDGGAQFSIGCRHTPSGVVAVDAACATVVASVRPA
ncbi:type VII secretion-associated protein [Pseudonocardia asaccharolytica]|uniref:type VII secretion-associated protein n=1 Tax=Pseudonocardia asaccharolytica TaxID=54010 RepID=UPI0011BEA74E|nr:type VII secretion-associated protein [Pseudonocardia asaccharolytica]